EARIAGAGVDVSSVIRTVAYAELPLELGSRAGKPGPNPPAFQARAYPRKPHVSVTARADCVTFTSQRKSLRPSESERAAAVPRHRRGRWRRRADARRPPSERAGGRAGYAPGRLLRTDAAGAGTRLSQGGPRRP